MKHATLFLFCEIWWLSVQRTLCLSKMKHIWELTNFFTSNGISQSTNESGESWKISRCTRFLMKPQIFECYSKCDYVRVEINGHNEGAAMLAFSGMFLLGTKIKPKKIMIKPKNPWVSSQSALTLACVQCRLLSVSLCKQSHFLHIILVQAEDEDHYKVHSGLEKHQSFLLPRQVSLCVNLPHFQKHLLEQPCKCF